MHKEFGQPVLSPQAWLSETITGGSRGRLAATLWSKGEEKARRKFLAKLSESHESPSLSGTLGPTTLTTTPRLPNCVHQGKKRKLRCIQSEMHLFACLSHLDCTMLPELSLRKKPHTPLQGNPMRVFFVFFFLTNLYREKKKKKSPGHSLYHTLTLPGYARSDGSWDRQRP